MLDLLAAIGEAAAPVAGAAEAGAVAEISAAPIAAPATPTAPLGAEMAGSNMGLTGIAETDALMRDVLSKGQSKGKTPFESTMDCLCEMRYQGKLPSPPKAPGMRAGNVGRADLLDKLGGLKKTLQDPLVWSAADAGDKAAEKWEHWWNDLSEQVRPPRDRDMH